MFGRVFHLTVDLMLLSVALSGVKRAAGLTPAVSRIPSKDVRNVFRLWLETGEWIMDFSMVFMSRSRYFEHIQ